MKGYAIRAVRLRQRVVPLFTLLTYVSIINLGYLEYDYFEALFETHDTTVSRNAMTTAQQEAPPVRHAQLVHPFECAFEDDFLFPVYATSKVDHQPRSSIVSEYYQSSDELKTALTENIQNNREQARFIFLVGESWRKQLQSLLKDIAPADDITVEVYYAPGGVTYRHLFGAATLYPTIPFLIHNADISVGNVAILLDACPSLDDAALVGSRTDVLRTGAVCTEYSSQDSFDSYLTNAKHMDCNFLNNLRFPPFFWGAENVVASQLPKKIVANLCPFWTFKHYHAADGVASSNGGLREHRVRINHRFNSWKGDDRSVTKVCDVERLKAGATSSSL